MQISLRKWQPAYNIIGNNIEAQVNNKSTDKSDMLSWLAFGKQTCSHNSLWVLTDICFLCSGEPDLHSAGSWWSFFTKSELSCPGTRGLQLQQPWQQHPRVSLWTWVTDIYTVILSVIFLTLTDVGEPLCPICAGSDICLGLSSLLVATADYLSTLSMSSTSLGSDSELTGLDSVLWSSAVELRRVDTKGTLLKVQPP